MARRPKTRTLMDSYRKATSKGSKPPSVSLIVRGVKYKPGQNPSQVCPVGSLVRQAIAQE